MDNRYRLGFAIALSLIVAGVLLTLKGDSLVTQWSLHAGTTDAHSDHNTHVVYEAAGFMMLTIGFVMNLFLWVRLLPDNRTDAHPND